MVKESESLSLGTIIRALKKHYGPPGKPHPRDPFELILLENVAYLARPARQHEAFELLKRTVGTDALSILKAKPKDLEHATALVFSRAPPPPSCESVQASRSTNSVEISKK